jgi:hypothetical protein
MAGSTIGAITYENRFYLFSIQTGQFIIYGRPYTYSDGRWSVDGAGIIELISPGARYIPTGENLDYRVSFVSSSDAIRRIFIRSIPLTNVYIAPDLNLCSLSSASLLTTSPVSYASPTSGVLTPSPVPRTLAPVSMAPATCNSNGVVPTITYGTITGFVTGNDPIRNSGRGFKVLQKTNGQFVIYEQDRNTFGRGVWPNPLPVPGSLISINEGQIYRVGSQTTLDDGRTQGIVIEKINQSDNPLRYTDTLMIFVTTRGCAPSPYTPIEFPSPVQSPAPMMRGPAPAPLSLPAPAPVSRGPAPAPVSRGPAPAPVSRGPAPSPVPITLISAPSPYSQCYTWSSSDTTNMLVWGGQWDNSPGVLGPRYLLDSYQKPVTKFDLILTGLGGISSPPNFGIFKRYNVVRIGGGIYTYIYAFWNNQYPWILLTLVEGTNDFLTLRSSKTFRNVSVQFGIRGCGPVSFPIMCFNRFTPIRTFVRAVYSSSDNGITFIRYDPTVYFYVKNFNTVRIDNVVFKCKPDSTIDFKIILETLHVDKSLTDNSIYDVEFGTYGCPDENFVIPQLPIPESITIADGLYISVTDFSNKILFDNGNMIYQALLPNKANLEEGVDQATFEYFSYMSNSGDKLIENDIETFEFKEIGQISYLVSRTTHIVYIDYKYWLMKKTYSNAVQDVDVPGVLGGATGNDSVTRVFMFDIDDSNTLKCYEYNGYSQDVDYTWGPSVETDNFVQLRLPDSMPGLTIRDVEITRSPPRGYSQNSILAKLGFKLIIKRPATDWQKSSVSGDIYGTPQGGTKGTEFVFTYNLTGASTLVRTRQISTVYKRYDCQMVSGIPGFNCIANVINSLNQWFQNVISSPIRIENESEINEKVYFTPDCIGFIYDFINKNIYLIKSLDSMKNADLKTVPGSAVSTRMKFGSICPGPTPNRIEQGTYYARNRVDGPPFANWIEKDGTRKTYPTSTNFRIYVRSNVPLGGNWYLGQIDKFHMLCKTYSGVVGNIISPLIQFIDNLNRTIQVYDSGSEYVIYERSADGTTDIPVRKNSEAVKGFKDLFFSNDGRTFYAYTSTTNPSETPITYAVNRIIKDGTSFDSSQDITLRMSLTRNSNIAYTLGSFTNNTEYRYMFYKNSLCVIHRNSRALVHSYEFVDSTGKYIMEYDNLSILELEDFDMSPCGTTSIGRQPAGEMTKQQNEPTTSSGPSKLTPMEIGLIVAAVALPFLAAFTKVRNRRGGGLYRNEDYQAAASAPVPKREIPTSLRSSGARENALPTSKDDRSTDSDTLIPIYSRTSKSSLNTDANSVVSTPRRARLDDSDNDSMYNGYEIKTIVGSGRVYRGLAPDDVQSANKIQLVKVPPRRLQPPNERNDNNAAPIRRGPIPDWDLNGTPYYPGGPPPPGNVIKTNARASPTEPIAAVSIARNPVVLSGGSISVQGAQNIGNAWAGLPGAGKARDANLLRNIRFG